MGPPLSGGSLGCQRPSAKASTLSQRIGSAAQSSDEFTLFIDQNLWKFQRTSWSPEPFQCFV